MNSFGYYLKELVDGESVVLRANRAEFVRVTLYAGTGATITYSRVSSQNATAHTTGALQGTVAATELLSFGVDWPFYRVSVAGGPATVVLV